MVVALPLGAEDAAAAGSAACACARKKNAAAGAKAMARFTMDEVRSHNTPRDCWIIIHNKVYDVSKYVDFHPGGQVIAMMAGRDATDPFVAYHEDWVAEKRLGNFLIGEVTDVPVNEITKEYRAIVAKVKRDGLLEPDKRWYVGKMAAAFSILASSFAVLSVATNGYLLALSAVLLGLYWHQCAFLAHDILHNVFFPKAEDAHLLAIVFANLSNGVSAAWWKYTHNQHHVVTNEFDRDPDILQMPFFAVTERLFEKTGLKFPGVLLIRFQRLTFFPVMLVARFNLYAKSYILLIQRKVPLMPWQPWNLSRKIYTAEVLSVLFFWAWYGTLLYFVPAYFRLYYFLISHCCLAMLHIQIVLSHWSQEKFLLQDDSDRWQDFCRTQIVTSRNIDGNFLNHWFYGGLEYQVEHHLFPRMPRHNFSKVQPHIRELARKHGVEYSSVGFWHALKDVLDNFSQVSMHA